MACVPPFSSHLCLFLHLSGPALVSSLLRSLSHCSYTPFEDTLHDAGESIIQLGLLPNKTTGDEASTPTAPSFSAYRPAEEDGFFSRVSKMFW